MLIVMKKVPGIEDLFDGFDGAKEVLLFDIPTQEADKIVALLNEGEKDRHYFLVRIN